MQVKITKQIIEQKYVQEQINHSEIAKQLGVTDCAVRKAIRRYGYKVTANKTGPPLEDLTGKVFNGYKVIQRAGRDSVRRATWLCECNCGNMVIISSQDIKQKLRASCMRCRRVHYGKIHSGYFNLLKTRAKKKGILFTVTGPYLWKVFQEQNGLCKYLNVPLCFVENYKLNSKTQTASLDRIDSTKGYVEGNVQWVHKDINTMKWDFSEGYFLKMCKTIVGHRKL